MARVLLVVLLVVSLAATAGAFDPMYSFRNAGTHEAGFGFRGAWIYRTSGDWYDHEGNKESYDGGKVTEQTIPIDFYYSVSEKWELGAYVPMQFTTWDWSGASRDEDKIDGSGIGDLWLWTKYRFTDAPWWAAQLGFKVNTGSAPNEPPWDWDTGDNHDKLATGHGQMDVDVALLFSLPGETGQFDANLGYRYRMSGDFEYDLRAEKYKWDPGDEVHFWLGYEYFLNEQWGLGLAAEGFYGQDDKVDYDVSREAVALDESAVNAVYLVPYVGYDFGNGWSTGLGFEYMLLGQNHEANWGLDLTVGWNW